MDSVGIVNPVFFVGVIEDRDDPRLEGRVKVRAFGFHGDNTQIQTEDLPWATLIVSHSSNFTPPPLNAWVLGFFIDGRDAQQPMVLGVIPTQMITPVNPSTQGYGSIAPSNHDLHSKGHRPQDFGQPMMPASARGEFTEQSHALVQETNRVISAKIAGSDDTWDEPSTAYAPKYPFNHVYETAGGHSIEVDDTPGAERILIFHKAGAFVQIDNNGNMTTKSPGDARVITEGNNFTFIGSAGSGARSVVTIMGDSYVYVDGNKTEEIRGDYTQIVRGNCLLDIAGQLNINTGEESQLRAAKITMESNVEHFSAKSAKEIRFTSAEQIQMKTKGLVFQSEDFSLKSDTLFGEISGSVNLKGGTISFESSGSLSAKASDMKIGASGSLMMRGSTVFVDDIVRLAEGGAVAPDSIEGEAKDSTEAISADLPEPSAKSIQTNSAPNQRATAGGGGYASRDDGDDTASEASFSPTNSTSPTTGGTASVNAINNPVAVRELYDYMINDAGLTSTQAIGALVNVQRESGFNSGAVGDNGNSFGLFQFNRPAGRAQPFLNAVPDWQTNPRGQIIFMFTKDPQGAAYKNRSFSSNLEAANWFTNRVEIPQARADYTRRGGYNEVNLPQIESIVGQANTRGTAV